MGGLIFLPHAHWMGPFFSPGVDAGMPAYSWSPIPIRLRALAVSYWDEFEGPSTSGQLQGWVDGALVGNPLSVGTGQVLRSVFDPLIDIPALVEANVGGAARFGTVGVAGSDVLQATLAYEWQNDSDVGKHIMGIGGRGPSTYVTQEPGGFAPLATANGALAAWGSQGSTFFSFQETKSLQPPGGPSDTVPPGSIRAPYAFEVADMMLGIYDPAGATGAARWDFRRNGEVVATIETSNTGARVWPADEASWIAQEGDRCSIQCVSAYTSTLAGTILWTVRRLAAGGVLGAGESGGEF